MRLLNTRTLQLEEFFDTSTPDYAILSHTWEKEEVIFSDMANLGKARAKIGFAKLEGACRLAATQGYEYIWIDTCCIDKSSSAELSEAINSMYRWYEESKEPTQLADSRWFTRGWTLQELIAPEHVEFYTADWAYLGKKGDPNLLSTLSHASLISAFWPVNSIPGTRKTTRQEDEAYCMMGLFDVNMPLLYGEGKKAFIRLQQEITKVTHDQSILAWYCDPMRTNLEPRGRITAKPYGSTYSGFCASSPSCFALSGDITSLAIEWAGAGGLGQIDFTGLMTKFSAVLKPAASSGGDLVDHEIILHCGIGTVPGTFPTLLLRRDPQNPQYFTRILYPGTVSKFYLYNFRSQLAETTIDTDPDSWLGLRIFRSPGAPAGGSSQLIATVGGLLYTGVPRESFPVQRVTIWKTTFVPADITKSRSIHSHPRDIEVARALTLASLPRAPFWLVPLAEQGSNISVSVMDVFPGNKWDRSSHQFFWDLGASEDSLLTLGMPITAGVAYIRLDLPKESGFEVGGQRTAIAKFELLPKPPKTWRFVDIVPWCSLVNSSGSPDLEQHFTTQVAAEDGQPRTSLALEHGFVLKAAIKQTVISGSVYHVMRVWVAVSGEQGEAETALDPIEQEA
ncbi:hypothetical protein B0I37DRAFT_408928 [Chaetomium sp. MPI-CAGE-AT-0009]|nr:hypothetical protein B0I37DRAFT_408928 [Chaetomium sp. MPI-CAGE-AT-0009]